MFWSPVVRILSLIVFSAGMLGGIAYWGYGRGFKAGASEVQERWDADKQAARDAHDAVIRKLAKEEAVHATEQGRVAFRLAQARIDSGRALAAQRREYEQRLLQSARRGEIYRDQAEAGATACGNLASHAAELDRALEEGRSLVGELREALGLRDRQVILLGQQILEDRRLFEGGETR